MAGVSTKEIKNRIRSMESTRQITKAMEMVAASKLRRAQAQVAASRPYFEILHQTIQDIVYANRDFSSPFFQKREGKKAMYIVIAGDRGLSGGYNSNVLKPLDPTQTILPIGKKAVEYCVSRAMDVLTQEFLSAEKLSSDDCFEIAERICQLYLDGKFDRIELRFTSFVSVSCRQ